MGLWTMEVTNLRIHQANNKKNPNTKDQVVVLGMVKGGWKPTSGNQEVDIRAQGSRA